MTALPLLNIPDSQEVVQFYSQSSKDTEPVTIADHSDWRRYISNFHFVPNKDITYRGQEFPSIEHAFASVKYEYSTSNGDNAVPSFVTGSVLGNRANIKSEHSRAGMKKYRFAMDVAKFDQDKEGIMRSLITERARVDKPFHDILISIHSQGYYLLHFARGGGGGWGGYQSKTDGKYYGDNLLGVLMMEWASDASQHLLEAGASKDKDHDH